MLLGDVPHMATDSFLEVSMSMAVMVLLEGALPLFIHTHTLQT